jgi:hypothetical protein
MTTMTTNPKSMIRKALAAIFGGKQSNGFVSTTPAAQDNSKTKADAILRKMIEEDAVLAPLMAKGERIAERRKYAEELAASFWENVTADLPKGITFKEYTWGGYFYGTRAALVKAGLVPPNAKPNKGCRDGTKRTYRLPLNHEEGYMEACFGAGGAIPPAWDATFWTDLDAKGGHAVRVEYWHPRDLDMRPRCAAALAELDAEDCDKERLRVLIANIPPRPLCLSVLEEIQKSKHYGKARK